MLWTELCTLKCYHVKSIYVSLTFILYKHVKREKRHVFATLRKLDRFQWIFLHVYSFSSQDSIVWEAMDNAIISSRRWLLLWWVLSMSGQVSPRSLGFESLWRILKFLSILQWPGCLCCLHILKTHTNMRKSALNISSRSNQSKDYQGWVSLRWKKLGVLTVFERTRALNPVWLRTSESIRLWET